MVLRTVIVGACWFGAFVSVACSRGPERRDARADAVESIPAALAPEAPGVTGAAAPPEGASRADRPEAYPEGRWQHIPPIDLQNTVLWISHILVRHSDVEQAEAVFNVFEWYVPQPRSTRSRADALALANSIAQTARERGQFEELARRHSEDPVTRDTGGSLGGISAGQMATFSEVLDALVTLGVGDVSRPVETVWGYHVFYRRPPPPEATVTGRRIVIGHEDAQWLHHSERAPLPRRSRAEALALASELYERARRSPADFEQLVDKYSEHRDALRGGDMGSWSTREWSPFPRELELLATLKVGEIAPPRDSLFGYQIIQRAANVPRKEHAFTRIQLRYDETVTEGLGSESAARALAERLLAEVTRDPARFSALQEQYCCTDTLRVIEGRDAPGIEALLATLEPDQIAPRILRNSSFEYLIVKKVDVSALEPKPSPRWDFPSLRP